MSLRNSSGGEHRSFRKHRSFINAIYVLQQIMQKHQECKPHMTVNTIPKPRRVARHKSWAVLLRRSFSSGLKISKILYKDTGIEIGSDD